MNRSLRQPPEDHALEPSRGASAARAGILKVLRAAPQTRMDGATVHRRLVAGGAWVCPSTVYRVLSKLAMENLVTRECGRGGHAVYSLAMADCPP